MRTSRLLRLLVHEAATAFARSALFARLAQQSRTDALTGALNRRALDDELHLALLNARRDGSPVSIAVLDLDHFKAYNDTTATLPATRCSRAHAPPGATRCAAATRSPASVARSS